MSKEIERRLERLLRLPRPTDDVEQRALATALAALPAPEPAGRRPLRTLLLIAAATIVLLALAAGALATVGALHVSLGQPAPPRRTQAPVSPASRLRMPAGARGIAAVIDGRLWLTTRSGVRIEGLPVESASLSPHALYVAAGIGDSLVAMAPNGMRAWSYPAGGRVVAIAWAPNGLQVAYVVERRGGFQLRTIEGDGDHDRLLDGAVRPVAPSWRSDALALAYVGAGGLPVVYDLAHRSRRVIESVASRDAARIVFAPSGQTLAVASAHQLWVARPGAPSSVRDFSPDTVAGLSWVGHALAVGLNPPPTSIDSRPVVQLLRVAPGGEVMPQGRLLAPGAIQTLDADQGRLVLASRGTGRGKTRLLELAISGGAARALLEVPAGAAIRDLAAR